MSKFMAPTPLYCLDKGVNNLYIKRDDLFPFSFGGNKARKGVLFWEEFLAGGYSCVVTYGSSSSNHCRVIANLAASYKVPCYIISPEEASQPTYNSYMMGLFGAEITCVSVHEVHDTIEAKLQELEDQGEKPYFIYGGGHGNIGTEAYVQAYKEISEFEEREGISFDYIFHASGTGTTQAGLIAGKLLSGDTKQIVGISIARKNPRGGLIVQESVEEYLRSIGSNIDKQTIDYNTLFVDDYTSDGYGSTSDEIQEVIQRVIKMYGIPLDKTYTAKAWWGMERYLISHEIAGKNILFIHTGGTPLFFDGIHLS